MRKDEEQAQLQKHSECARRHDGQIEISPAHLKQMSFSTQGLAQARIDGAWYYVKKNGKVLQVITYDNGADYFEEGLTRSIIEENIAYFDTDFKQVIPPKYDWGWPFENGKALVCIGCKPGPVDRHGHGFMEGGQWGYIDRQAREIIPVRFSREEVNGQAVTDFQPPSSDFIPGR